MSSFGELFLLALAVSMDVFAAGFSYGTAHVSIPFFSVLLVNGISSLVLGFSLLLGCAAGRLFPGTLFQDVSFVILFVLGITKLFDRCEPSEAAVGDKNKDFYLSPAEGLVLGAVLSLDSLAAGIGAGIGAFEVPSAFLLSFFIGVLALMLGRHLGAVVSSRCKLNLSWLGGGLLILLAFLRRF